MNGSTEAGLEVLRLGIGKHRFGNLFDLRLKGTQDVSELNGRRDRVICLAEALLGRPPWTLE